MDLNTPVSKLFMVGAIYAKRLEKIEIKNLKDLLYHFPHRYEDYSLTLPIAWIPIGKPLTIKGRLLSIRNYFTRNGKKIQKAVVADKTGQIEVVWFNQPFLTRILKTGTELSLSGKAEWFGRQKSLITPEYEIVTASLPIHTGRLVPIYPETYGVSSKWLRSKIAPLILKSAVELDEFLPRFLLSKKQFPPFKKALRQIHLPQNQAEAESARKRFAFEELLLTHLEALRRKKTWQTKKTSFPFKFDSKKITAFIQSLPFELTSAQKKAAQEILADLTGAKPMNRLLQGDVGSGKTIVAAVAIYAAFLAQTHIALMAPTEILANQHYQTLKKLLKPLGIKTALLTGTNKKNQSGWDLIIGTHALIYRKAEFRKLSLIIIDEQHRFGVEQRAKLIAKAGRKNKAPHFLTMTATPIPRTVALTLYQDLDLSLIDELPPGRKKIKTWVVPDKKRTAAYDWIRQRIQKGDQAFIICPLIEESAFETLTSVKAVKTEFLRLKKTVFPRLSLGLLHGRMKTKEKDLVLNKFKAGKIDILVSTPVVEVGIDIENATIMTIEAADRFGLAQLHQLRGRVGRGKKQSYCLLFAAQANPEAIGRLKSMEKNLTGSKLAEIDLKSRGPGEIYGIKQHGFLKFKIASLADFELVKETQKEAQKILDRLNQYPPLKKRLEADTIGNIEPN
ncbi:MAG: ATP-dependent DNA helicase RecG [Candidatus Pacebacteria bacterium]|nr:ATP-dependent DNA helicase RecG [Candidatus Paceibacterota bacterium]